MKRSAILLAGAMAIMPNLAQAQADPADADQGGLTDIVVTAQKRSENIQKVPIAITALSSAQLGAARVNNINNLSGQVPSLAMQAPYGDAIPIFSLRGISVADYSQNQSSPVAVYVDEVYKGAAVLTSLQVFDVDRIEVLRGPQGTLYGKNTTGGAVNFYTTKPDLTGGVSGYLSAGYGNYDRYESSGAVNVPIIDGVLAVRAAFTYAKQDGFIKNLVGKDLESVNDLAGRISVAFKPSDRLSFNLRYTQSRSKPTGFAVQPINVASGGIAGSGYIPTGLGFYESEITRPGFQRIRNKGIALTTNWDVSDDIALTSVTAYDKGSWPQEFNALGSPIDLAHGIFSSKAKAFQQDLRLASSGNGAYKWLFGAFYYRDRVKADAKYQFFYDFAGDNNGNGTLDCFDPDDGFTGCAYGNALNQLRESYALYTQHSYEIADGLTLTGGLRYTKDKVRLDSFKSFLSYLDPATGQEVSNFAEIISEPPADATSRTNENVGGKIGIDYQITPETLLYASVSRGYRGAAFNGQAFFDQREVTAVEPERLDSIELGAKTQFFDNRVRLNVALFHYDYKNQQFIDGQTAGGVPLTVLVNAPKSRLWGAELEVTAKPVDAVELRLGGSYLNAEFKKASLRDIDLKGNRLINAPEWTFNAAADWTVYDAKDVSLKLRANTRYTSRVFYNAFNDPLVSQGGYWVSDGGVTVGLFDGKLELSGWMKNIANKHYYTYLEDNLDGFGIVAARRARPREYGITTRFTF